MFFFVKVRIDLNKLMELGRKLQTGELDKSNLKMTYCMKDDPAVGVNIWEADSEEMFESKFAPHREYYKEVIEITPVITTKESMEILMAQLEK